jgi:hypothetical protein
VLEKFALNLLDFMLLPEMQKLDRTLIAAAPQFPKLPAEFWRLCPEQEQNQLADYLDSQISSGVLVPFDSRKVAELFFSLCLGQFLLHAQMVVRKTPNIMDQKAYIREAIHLFLAAYQEKPQS